MQNRDASAEIELAFSVFALIAADLQKFEGAAKFTQAYYNGIDAACCLFLPNESLQFWGTVAGLSVDRFRENIIDRFPWAGDLVKAK